MYNVVRNLATDSGRRWRLSRCAIGPTISVHVASAYSAVVFASLLIEEASRLIINDLCVGHITIREAACALLRVLRQPSRRHP
jgi:hypothetical protein